MQVGTSRDSSVSGGADYPFTLTQTRENPFSFVSPCATGIHPTDELDVRQRARDAGANRQAHREYRIGRTVGRDRPDNDGCMGSVHKGERMLSETTPSAAGVAGAIVAEASEASVEAEISRQDPAEIVVPEALLTVPCLAKLARETKGNTVLQICLYQDLLQRFGPTGHIPHDNDARNIDAAQKRQQL